MIKISKKVIAAQKKEDRRLSAIKHMTRKIEYLKISKENISNLPQRHALQDRIDFLVGVCKTTKRNIDLSKSLNSNKVPDKNVAIN